MYLIKKFYVRYLRYPFTTLNESTSFVKNFSLKEFVQRESGLKSMYQVGSIMLSILTLFAINTEVDNVIRSKIVEIAIWATRSTSGQTIATVVLLVVGIFLYILRETKRMTYSRIEMIAGAFTVFYSLPKLAANSIFSGGLAVLGGLYIIVRSCDNFKKAYEEKERDMPAIRKKRAEKMKKVPIYKRKVTVRLLNKSRRE